MAWVEPVEAKTSASQLKLMTVPIQSAERHDKTIDDFEVLVRVEAPQVGADCAPIDLVAVVDVSGSMGFLPELEKDADKTKGQKSRMDYLKEALKFIINELDEDDRLAIVQFNVAVKHSTELSLMSSSGRESARKLVEKLNPNDGTVFKPALEKAISILDRRDNESCSKRVPFVVFLSDGKEEHPQDNRSSNNKIQWDQLDTKHQHFFQELRKYPVYTFGFGSTHDPATLKTIADASNKGTFSYVIRDLDNITDAFATCLGAFTTVVALNATITLRATPGVATIVKIESGAYKNEIMQDSSWKIFIPQLQEGESKDFIVHLKVPAAPKAGVPQVLLTAGGTFDNAKDLRASEIEDNKLSIDRPAEDPGAVPNTMVLEQVTRFKLVFVLEQVITKGEAMITTKGEDLANMVTKNWNKMKTKLPWLSNKFDEDVKRMAAELPGGSTGKAYVYSYLSSQQTQRATTMGSARDVYPDYKTPGIIKMADKAQKAKERPCACDKLDKIEKRLASRSTALREEMRALEGGDLLQTGSILNQRLLSFHEDMCKTVLEVVDQVEHLITNGSGTAAAAVGQVQRCKSLDLLANINERQRVWCSVGQDNHLRMQQLMQQMQPADLAANLQKASMDAINQAKQRDICKAVADSIGHSRRCQLELGTKPQHGHGAS